MPVWSPTWFGSAGGAGGFVISQSALFDGAGDNLSRTPSGAPTSSRTSTMSVWIKRAEITDTTYDGYIFCCSPDEDGIALTQDDDKLAFRIEGSTYVMTAVNQFRDPSTWWHLVLRIDSTQSTDTNRIRIYINGSQLTLSGSFPAQNYDYTRWLASGRIERIGWNGATQKYFNGYLAEFAMYDGQSLGPDSFGETNDSGIWVPIQIPSSGFGNNGFHLTFSDSSALGADTSGNSNNFTVNNLVAANQVEDSPTNDADNDVGNYAVINPEAVNIGGNSDVTLSEGNLKAVYVGDHAAEFSIARLTSGKWYWELKNTTNAAGSTGVIQGSYYGTLDRSANLNSTGIYYYNPSNGQKMKDGSGTSYGSATSTNDILQVALDLDNNKIWWGINNTWQASGDPAAGSNEAYSDLTDTDYTPVLGYGGAYTSILNCGQSGLAYTPPAGFKTLNTANMTALAFDPEANFKSVTYTGTGSELAITSLAFQPGFVIIKNRDAADNWMIYDVVRGATVEWHPNSNLNEADTTTAQTLKSFDSAGFTLGTDVEVNTSSEKYVALNWKTGTSSTISNAMTKTSDSSQTNITRAVDTDTGVSIMKYTGTGAISTILHGLGKVPGMVWVRATNKSGVCKAWHTGLSNATRSYIVFAQNQAETNFSDDRVWGAGHTSTAIGVGTHTYTNNLNDTYIAYAFAETPISSFGTFLGNNNSDGPFVYLGFKPALLILKKTASGSWYIWDNGRMVNNPAGGAVYPLRPDDTATESGVGSGGLIDFLGNGFKIRSTWGDINGSGVTVTYSAWAESPFSGNNRAK
tara:strand:+ start:8438 stop:10846 length:2409 start_codon:yes stop_codon:yes gene_type:complete